MKKYLIGIICIGLTALVGCAQITYKTTAKDGSESKATYSRLGLQAINDCKVEKGADGSLKLEFSQQQGGEKILDVLTNLSQTAENMSKALPKTTP